MQSAIEKQYGIRSEDEKLQRLQQRIVLIALALAIAVSFIFGLLNRKEDLIKVTDDNRIEFFINGLCQGLFSLDDVIDISYVNTVEFERLNEADEGNVIYGTGTTSTDEELEYYLYDNVKSFIWVTTSEKSYVFNYINDSYTEGFYQGLIDLWQE